MINTMTPTSEAAALDGPQSGPNIFLRLFIEDAAALVGAELLRNELRLNRYLLVIVRQFLLVWLLFRVFIRSSTYRTMHAAVKADQEFNQIWRDASRRQAAEAAAEAQAREVAEEAERIAQAEYARRKALIDRLIALYRLLFPKPPPGGTQRPVGQSGCW